MGLLTIPPAEANAVGPARPHSPEAACRAARKGVASCVQTCRTILHQLDQHLVAGGGLTAVQAELSAGEFTSLQNCYNAMRDMVIALDPKGVSPRTQPLAQDPPDFTRDRTIDVAAFSRTLDASRSASRILATLARCSKDLERRVRVLDAFVVKGGGAAALQAVMGASDFTELQDAYTDMRTVVLDLDPGANVPDFTRDRSAEIARKTTNHPAP